jgi:hypothetical protein
MQRRFGKTRDVYTCIYPIEEHIGMIAVCVELGDWYIRAPTCTHPCRRREGVISMREQSIEIGDGTVMDCARRWTIITGRAHHRSSPHGCGFVYALRCLGDQVCLLALLLITFTAAACPVSFGHHSLERCFHAGVSRHAHHADDQTTRSMPKTD